MNNLFLVEGPKMCAMKLYDLVFDTCIASNRDRWEMYKSSSNSNSKAVHM